MEGEAAACHTSRDPGFSVHLQKFSVLQPSELVGVRSSEKGSAVMQPRWYQAEAVQQAWEFIRQKPGNPCIVLPTGAGKSLVIAMIARDVVAWQGRALVLAHRAELLKQNAEKISSCLPGLDVGVFSAGLGKKDHGQDVVVAGVQSCYKKKAAYNIGHRDILIVDEAHLIPLSGDGMYRQLLEHLLAINH